MSKQTKSVIEKVLGFYIRPQDLMEFFGMGYGFDKTNRYGHEQAVLDRCGNLIAWRDGTEICFA